MVTVIATDTIARATQSAFGRSIPRHFVSHRTGFWFVSYAFTALMAFGALPTPLYVLYARRDQFSAIDVTVIFATYAVGVVLSLLLVGHVSDWVGRRRMLLAAVGLSLVSGAVFLTWTSFVALLIARLASGLGVGIVTTTATAHLAELYAQRHPGGTSRRAEVVAAAANLGGLGLGPLLAGLLAQFAPNPLRTPYVVSVVLLIGAGMALAVTPETVRRAPGTPYRPQQLLIPATSRRTFAAAAVGAAVTFTVFGTFSALVPGFLAGTLHNASHAVAGAVASAVFLAGAIAQVATSRIRIDPARASVLAAGGLALLAIATWTAALPLFVLGALITGAGVGAVFKSMLAAVVALAPSGHRGEVLATFFLAAYLGLALPVVALGALAQLLSTAVLMTAFAVTASVALVAAASSLRQPGEQTGATTTALRRQPRVN
ncbi:MAG TPA: MFS transporter [Mycobacterium sp.]|nr:MFS transporter [Mycobacterium sp.]